MKRAFTVSLLLNVLLAVWIARNDQHPRKFETQNSPEPKTSNRPEHTQPPEDQPHPVVNFRWGQLESTDYRQYIGNLKAIGCPQQTIRDIITADVHSLYVARGEKLDREPMQAPARTAKLHALQVEENSVLTALLGPLPDSQSTNDNLPATRATQAQAQSSNVSIPLAFRPIDFSALNLNEDQFESVQFLRNAFQREIREPGYDRSSPEYLEQWQSAQAQNDLMLRGMLGTKLYEQIESLPRTAPNPPR